MPPPGAGAAAPAGAPAGAPRRAAGARPGAALRAATNSLYSSSPAVNGRAAAVPSHRSQSSVAGTGVGGGVFVIPCGQLGRLIERVDLGDVADLARPDDLARDARRVVRVPLVAHLRRDLVLLRRLPEQARLRGDPRQRLLDVDALAALHAPQRA